MTEVIIFVGFYVVSSIWWFIFMGVGIMSYILYGIQEIYASFKDFIKRIKND
jgi:hypothetical protein